jgi:hypothetical protein
VHKRPFIFCSISKLDAVIGQDRVNVIRNDHNQLSQEPASRVTSLIRVQFGVGELRRAAGGDKQIKSSFFSVHLGYINMKIADRILLELFLNRFVTFNFRQAADAVPLQTAMQT